MGWLARIGGWLWSNREELVEAGGWVYATTTSGRRAVTFCPTCKAKVPCVIHEGKFTALCPIHGLSR